MEMYQNYQYLSLSCEKIGKKFPFQGCREGPFGKKWLRHPEKAQPVNLRELCTKFQGASSIRPICRDEQLIKNVEKMGFLDL